MIDQTQPKFTLTIAERQTLRARINLEDYGFEKISSYEFKNNDFYRATTSEWCAVFTNKQYNIPVEYDKLEQWLLNKGYLKKNTIT